MQFFFYFQAEDGIRDADVTGVQTCALPFLGIPVIPTTATTGEGLEALKDAAIRVALGQLRPRPTPVPQTAGEPATLLYGRAEEIASLVVRGQTRPGADLTARLDRLIISPTWGLFLMLALLAGVFWLTI